MKKRKPKHEEPSPESLREIPEVDLRRGEWRPNPYAARIAKEGYLLPGDTEPRFPEPGEEEIERDPAFWKMIEARRAKGGKGITTAEMRKRLKRRAPKKR